MWSSITLYGHAGKVQVSRFAIPLFTLFTQLFSSLWRQPLIERDNQVTPLRDIELFAEPVHRFVAEFSAPAGLGRIIRPYAARDCRASDSDGAALHVGVDAFDVMVSLAAGRSLEDGVATDVSRLLDVFPHYGPPCTARRGGTLLFRVV